MTPGIDRLRPIRKRFLVGINTGYVTGGVPDQRYVDFYADRSSPALHCAIIGNVVIPGGYGSNANTPTIDRSQIWALIAKAISDRGTIPGIQLATAWEGYQGSRRFRARHSSDTIGQARKLARTIGSFEISKILQSLEDGTLMAIDAGFRHVQLHAAHGYLFNLLIDDRIYDGADDVLGRLAEWFERIGPVVSETSIRISLRSGDSNFDSVGGERFQDKVAAMPVCFVDASSGFYNIDKQLIYPGRPDTLLARRVETLALASRHRNAQFILSGRALLSSEDTLPSNVHIGLCRDLLANPRYLQDAKLGCANSGKCHYYSRGAAHITCSQWGMPARSPSLKADSSSA